MNPLVRNILVGAVIFLLFIEFGYQFIKYDREAEAERPVGQDGKIKDGKTVSFEEEERLALKSFPTVKETEVAQSMLYGLSQCLISAETIGENAYICISNNVDDKALKITTFDSDIERGKYIHGLLSEDKQITNFEVLLDEQKSGLNYNIKISLDRDIQKTLYKVVIEDRKIVSIVNTDEPTGEEINNEE
jgi:hypothetical protein